GFHFVPLMNLLRDLLNSFSLGLSVNVGRWYVLAIDGLFLIAMIAGFLWLVGRGAPAKRRRTGWLLAGYLGVPVTLTYLLSYVRPVYMNSRHLILVAPAFYLMVAAGLSGISQYVNRKVHCDLGEQARAARIRSTVLYGLRFTFYALIGVLLLGIGYSTV